MSESRQFFAPESVFDFLTFYVMLALFNAGETLFHTGWFVESLATQVLVIFVIRTRGSPLKSRAHPWLVTSSLIVVALAAILPYTPFAATLGFVPLPFDFFLVLMAMVLLYLLIVKSLNVGFTAALLSGMLKKSFPGAFSARKTKMAVHPYTPEQPAVNHEGLTMNDHNQTDWESRYRAGTTAWDRGEPSPALRNWLEHGELTPCRILVPGCGRGYEVAELARRGFAVTAVDIAPSAIQAVQALLADSGLHAEIVRADLLGWQPEHPFDAVYEQTCLCALDPVDLQTYAARLWTWLKPGGRLYALFMQTHKPGGPPYHCELTDMRTLFDGQRWIWPNTEAMQVPHPNGLYELSLVLVRR